MTTLVPPGMTPDKPLYIEGSASEDGVRARAAALQAAATITVGTLGSPPASGWTVRQVSEHGRAYGSMVWALVATFENYILTGEHP
jgi:hypothetical protein